MDLLYAGALLEPELRLAIRTADISVGLDVADAHILALEEIAHRTEDIGKTAVLIYSLGDVLRESAKDHQRNQQQDQHDHDGATREKIDHIEDRRDDQDKIIEFVVSVTALHESRHTLEKVSHKNHLT